MLQDIQAQAAALVEAVPDLRQQVARLPFDERRSSVVLTGSGDSWIAALAVEPLFASRFAGSVRALPALDASRYRRWREADLAVAISVSGEVSRAIEVVLRARASGASTIAITASPRSTLAMAAEHVLLMPPPIDRSIPHSRDYTLTLAALAVLLEWLTHSTMPELGVWTSLISALVDDSFRTIRDLQQPSGRTWFLGAGPDRASAMYGALKFWEAAGLAAWWDDLEEFGHGSQLMAVPADRAVLIVAGEGLDRAEEMIPGLRRMGIEPLVVSEDTPGLPVTHLATRGLGELEWHPFVSCIPLQVLAYRDATDQGLDVSVPLFGREYGQVFEDVHVEWTKRSRIYDSSINQSRESAS